MSNADFLLDRLGRDNFSNWVYTKPSPHWIGQSSRDTNGSKTPKVA